MQRSASNAGPDDESTVVVHVQLRPRRGATRKCLAALAALAAEHDTVAFAITGLSKDERVVRITVGVELGPRAGVAKFSPQAQAAYAFVSAVFASLYEHMPVYTAEPTEAERTAAAALLDTVTGGAVFDEAVVEGADPQPEPVPAGAVPRPRPAGPGERIPA